MVTQLPNAPEQSLQNRRDALKTANEIRGYRAALKCDLKAKRVHVINLLNDPPQEIMTMKVCDLLLAVPKFGRVKVPKLLNTCRISPSKTIGGLSPRQRTEIVTVLRMRV